MAKKRAAQKAPKGASASSGDNSTLLAFIGVFLAVVGFLIVRGRSRMTARLLVDKPSFAKKLLPWYTESVGRDNPAPGLHRGRAPGGKPA